MLSNRLVDASEAASSSSARVVRHHRHRHEIWSASFCFNRVLLSRRREEPWSSHAATKTSTNGIHLEKKRIDKLLNIFEGKSDFFGPFHGLFRPIYGPFSAPTLPIGPFGPFTDYFRPFHGLFRPVCRPVCRPLVGSWPKPTSKLLDGGSLGWLKSIWISTWKVRRDWVSFEAVLHLADVLLLAEVLQLADVQHLCRGKPSSDHRLKPSMKPSIEAIG